MKCTPSARVDKFSIIRQTRACSYTNSTWVDHLDSVVYNVINLRVRDKDGPLQQAGGAVRNGGAHIQTVETRRWECDRTGSRTHVLWVHDWGPYH